MSQTWPALPHAPEAKIHLTSWRRRSYFLRLSVHTPAPNHSPIWRPDLAASHSFLRPDLHPFAIVLELRYAHRCQAGASSGTHCRGTDRNAVGPAAKSGVASRASH